MDYRAAATRQLKESLPNSTAAATPNNKGNAANSSQPATTAAPNPPAALSSGGDSGKMKGNANAWSTVAASKKATAPATGAKTESVSYAATAAAKKAAGSGNAGAGLENGSARRSGSGRAAPAVPLSSLVDTQIRVTLISDAVVEGVLFTYDVYSGVMALISEEDSKTGASQQQSQSNGSPSVSNGQLPSLATRVHLIKASNVKDVQVTSRSSSIVIPKVGPVAVSTIEARKKRSLAQAQERASRIGVGVTDDAQSIFEALSRTLPCRWDQNKIVVLDEVVIDSPYSTDNCRELTSASLTLQRVKKVLQGELQRIASQQTISNK
ncbi:hypothetical protein GGI15_002024 [Coemansia interrupta]|uniref:AD domain-containing protein n=1 Tax=Coemansia interrupta TaxID=1126814 RepID=A0A9W8LMP1_9FUNG|nr:hypothetical protein GGI15_002024 [Coemansia interrupta]